jgi:hypothetical protein
VGLTTTDPYVEGKGMKEVRRLWVYGMALCLLAVTKFAFGNPMLLTPLDIPLSVPQLRLPHFLVLALINYGFDLLVLLFILDWFGLLGTVSTLEVLKVNLWIALGGWLGDLFGYWSVKGVGFQSEFLVGMRFMAAITLIAGWVILIWNFVLARWLLDMETQEAFVFGLLFALFTAPWSLVLISAFLSESLLGILAFLSATAVGTYKLGKTYPTGEGHLFRSRLLFSIVLSLYWLLLLLLTVGMWQWLVSQR